ncbi:MAG: KOW domain-containing RNA-binding protein [Defluviitaleaceae bacterium]|nr:KOW domain-containing RNA-binding protein [Defluviitaleaceae bacterium]
MDLQIGQIVISKAGRDKGFAFVITRLEDDYALLVDGKSRLLTNPKRKKAKHLQPMNHVDAALARMIVTGAYLKDADFRTAIKVAFKNKEVNSHG